MKELFEDNDQIVILRVVDAGTFLSSNSSLSMHALALETSLTCSGKITTRSGRERRREGIPARGKTLD